jgi:uroporphyrinogen decarboxylase
LTPADRFEALELLHLDCAAAYPELPDGRPLLGAHLAARPTRGGRVPGWPVDPVELVAPDELDWTPLRTMREATPRFVLAVLPGPFGELAALGGIDRLLVACWRRPQEVRALAEAMVDYGLALARRGLEEGAEGFVIGEDVAYDGGLLLRPTLYRRIFLPALEREVAALGALGLPVILHSDGDLSALRHDLDRLGLAGLHSCPFAAAGAGSGAPGGDGDGDRPGTTHPRVDGRAPWPLNGGPPCRWGNLGLDAFLAGDEAAVAARVDEAIEAGGGDAPGYVFGTSAGILDASLPARAVLAAYAHAHAHAHAAGDGEVAGAGPSGGAGRPADRSGPGPGC